MRALDAAKARLDALSDRNAILDCFFEFGRDLFQFSVLFIVREGTAHGRRVHGLGAPDDLIARLALPLNAGPGILRRVRELRRPFVTSNAVVTDADARLFGSIGRAMPAGVVVPLVLRDRVVAIFLGDGPAEPLRRRGAELGRPPVDLAKDEMILWGEAVSSALEQLILRRKSIRPPGLGSIRPPPLAGAPEEAAPRRLPPPGNLPVWSLPGDEGYDEAADAMANADDAEAPNRSGLYLVGAGIAAAILIASGLYMVTTRAERPSAYRTITPGAKLAGWPQIDPLSVLDAARAAASGADARAELSSIQAEIGRDARVDFSERPQNPEGIYLTFFFVTPELEIQVRVDNAGLQAPLTAVRKVCGERPCRGVVAAPPLCSFAQIRDATVERGLKPEERALLTYADDRREGTSRAEGGPRWSLAVVDRGVVHLDAATCKPLPRERLFPPATPVAGLPGAPREVEPMALLPLARAQAGLEPDSVLLEIEARGIGSTGKLDLTGDGGLTYTFGDPANVPAATRRWREVIVDRSGMRLRPIMGWEPMPSRFTVDIMPPVCSFAHAFKGLGTVAPGTTATMRYGRGSGAGEAGEFDLFVASAALHRIVSDAECAADEKLKK